MSQPPTLADYIAADGSRAAWSVEGSPQQIAHGLPPEVRVHEQSDARETAQSLAQLPRDPQALRARMYQQAGTSGPSPDGEVMVLVADALRTGMVPADLRSAFYQVLSTIPGVQITKDQVLVGGVTGTSIGRYEPNGRELQEIVINPQTGAFIGERSTLANEQGQPVDELTTYNTVQRSVVDTIPQSVLDSPHTVEVEVPAAHEDDAPGTVDKLVTCAPGATRLDGTCSVG